MSKVGFILLSTKQLPINNPTSDKIYLSCLSQLKVFNKDIQKSGIFLVDKIVKKYSFKLLQEQVNSLFNVESKYITDIIVLPKKFKKTNIYLVVLDNNKLNKIRSKIESKQENLIVNIENSLLQFKLPKNYNDVTELDLFELIKSFHNANIYKKYLKINIYEYDRLINSVYICDIIEGLLGINKLNLIKNKC
tara:strand:+ start:183 stop:758 length:576 start_codon:yes stop_codon:yes gene_type:complete